MFSLIVSSYNQAYFNDLEKNVAETIGVPYEIIQIWNPGTMGICEAYNEGYHKAKNSILIFVHEDVLFNEKNWGAKLLKYFDEDPCVGLVGVAGSLAKTKSPSTWWKNGDANNYLNIRHAVKTVNDEKCHQITESSMSLIKKQVVSVLDGVFIAMQKNAGILFNEKIKGYHNYDLSISIDFIRRGWKVICVNAIDISHFSLGSVDEKWVVSADSFYEQYKQYLPLGLNDLTREEIVHLETNNLMNYIDKTIEFNIKRLGWKYCFKLWKIQPFSKRPYVMLKRLLK